MNKIHFEILWYSGGPEHAPNRCIGRTHTEQLNLDAAIHRACRMLLTKHPDTEMAKGFYVRKAPES